VNDLPLDSEARHAAACRTLVARAWALMRS
jgi:hypothetical protein